MIEYTWQVIALLIKRSFLFFVLAAVVLVCPIATQAETAAPDVSAKAAVVCCVNTGEVLYAKNAEEPLAMASTTKIMTALLTLEVAAENNQPVAITAQMTAVEGSSMGLQPGEDIRLRELAIGMLMVSGNDAANAAAIAIGGSAESFAALMNDRAASLGMTDTNFVTPSGLDDENHYTTAVDMAKLGVAAISNEDFRDICSRTSMTVQYENPRKTVTLQNHNKLLKLYDDCIGIKTGYTKKAGRCLVSAAERDGITLVAVTLSAPDDWNDHTALLDYGFSRLQSISTEEQFTLPVVGADLDAITVTTGEAEPLIIKQGQTVTKQIILPRFLYAPVTAGKELGAITYYADGEPVQTIPITAAENAPGTEKQENQLQKIGRWILTVFT